MQCVRLMCQKMSDEMENLINDCNSMEDIREKAKINNQLERKLLASLKPTKKLLNNIFERQSLKDELFEVFEPATKLEMKNFWELVHIVNDSIIMDDTSQKKVANKISSFLEVYGTNITEAHCPLLQNRKLQNMPNKAEKKCGNGMDFSLTVQFAKNVRTVTFIDLIEYSCEVTFKNILDLSFLSSKRQNNNLDELEAYEESNQIIRKRKILPIDDEEIDEENEDNDKDDNHNQESEKKTGHNNDPIAELFQLVQINAKHTCRSEIKKSYFVAGIFLQVCNLCGTSGDIIQVNDKLPYCHQCYSLPEEKRLMNKKNNNLRSRKKRKI
ncbi:hypothetical protein RclHR1_00350002 [Rhizophagus clarus]|uniref:Uncharacterized protein n=1 Tax=Rhizophagus clarus TaxID=94130 RepID=A0A2Z6S506_9GLOM|nr:hypothetical protein RclHR1_00350002 [Rhizophagus clarus]